MLICYFESLIEPTPNGYLEQLGLENESYLLPSQFKGGKLSESDRVLIIAASQANANIIKLIEDNPQVAEFIVYLPEASKSILDDIKNNIHRVGGLWVFKSEEEVLDRLNAPTLKSDKCQLVYYKTPPALLSQLEILLKEQLQISIETCALQEVPKSDAAYLFLLVEFSEDFSMKDFNFLLTRDNLPDGRTIRVLLLPKPENPCLAVWLEHHNDILMNELCKSLPALNWDINMMRKYSYYIDPQNELYRLSLPKKPFLLNTLRNEESFVMWDEQSLPMRAQDYTESVIRDFLAQFNGSERLAASLSTLKSNN